VYDFCRRLAEAHGDEDLLELLAARARLVVIMEGLKAISEQLSQLARENDESGLGAGDRRLLAAWNRVLALEAEFMAIDRRVRTLAAEDASHNAGASTPGRARRSARYGSRSKCSSSTAMARPSFPRASRRRSLCCSPPSKSDDCLSR
jgi:hypothetical protein